jgi:thiol-disulfide isomerase/thioredoxin
MANNIRLFLGSAVVSLIVLTGCSKSSAPFANATPVRGEKGSPGDKLLKMSMDHYNSLKSFTANCAWSMKMGGEPTTDETRTISYAAPNRFKVTTKTSEFTLSSTSDGSKDIEVASLGNQPAMSSPAPADISQASSMIMQHPMFCGTLLYKFFAGSAGYEGLVDASKGPAVLGSEEQAGGETAQHVKFYATGNYGHTDVLIGERTGKVYAITYDDEPLMGQMAAVPSAKKLAKPSCEEAYGSIEFDPKVDASVFDTKSVAEGMKVVDASDMNGPGGDEDKPPVPIGSVAPDFTVKPASGGAAVSLRSLRGKPVMVDFWATWCGPCKESLPHTEDIYKNFRSKGLQVMTVSDEDTKTIMDFVKENKYTFPAFTDTDDVMEKAYGIDGIPTIAIIDKDGKLQDFLVGERPEEEVTAALKKVGIG